MAKRSSFYVSSPSPFGQMAAGFGKGLAESLPPEIQRQRLASHLQNLGEQKDLTPFQQFSGLVSAPGATPQIIQSGSELLRQQQKLGAAEQRASALQQQQNLQAQEAQKQQATHNQQILDQTKQIVAQSKNQEGFGKEKHPTVTTPGHFLKAQQGYIPPSIDEQNRIALEKFNDNPAYYNWNPQNALAEQQQQTQREIDIQNAHENIYNKQQKIQEKAIEDLQKHSRGLAVQIPANLYDRFEDKFLDMITPGQGKRVKTPEEAKKIINLEMDEASRDYAAVKAFKDEGLFTRPSKETRSSLDTIQKNFAKRDDTRNLADILKTDLDISDELAYTLAEPVNQYKELNTTLRSIPTAFEATRKGPIEDTRQAGRAYFPKIFDSLKKSGGSPLAVAHELHQKGYDRNDWLEYATKRQEELSGLQIDQLKKPRNTFGTLSDWWLSTFTGIE